MYVSTKYDVLCFTFHPKKDKEQASKKNTLVTVPSFFYHSNSDLGNV